LKAIVRSSEKLSKKTGDFSTIVGGAVPLSPVTFFTILH